MSGQRAIQKVGQRPAVELPLKSRLTGPIHSLSWLQKSLLFAEISVIAYLDPDQCSQAAGRIGFSQGKFFNCDGAQAYLLANEYDVVVTCRGTEASEWNDIRADLSAFLELAETVGRVHRGFKKEVDDLWPRLEVALVETQLPVWFTGHSLGGAMATICAARCQRADIDAAPEGLYTFGAPRVGNRRYVRHANIEHYRWVNNNDIVPRVPPVWLGYRHNGRETYINRHGEILQLHGLSRLVDRFKGLLRSTMRWRIDYFSDHPMHNYIDAIDRAVRRERSLLAGLRRAA